ncbi:MAG: KamA family radical SAM protein [Planctomycetota bacterium]
MTRPSPSSKFRVFTARDLPELPQIRRLPEADRVAMAAVAAVLPFRVNNYVVDELIDWDAVPQDPIFQLTFPQPGMLKPRDFSRMLQLLARGRPEAEIKAAAREIQRSLNPHPGGQVNMNVPKLNGQAMAGVQHKYRETALFFPSAGQTCHSYCTYCFRWAQFVGVDDLRFAGRETETLVHYLRRHPEVTSVLITGGDPLIMRAKVLRRYIEPLLSPAAGLDHLESIRIGTKAPAYWPHRFTADPDADDLLRLFEDVQSAGKHLALMAHYSHPRELSTPASQEAVRRIRSTGAVIRCQAPLIRHVNDDPDVWAEMWRLQTRLGAVPYYMFVERDTGAAQYFEVPLARAFDVFTDAQKQVSGLCRTVRGPSMSATPGKVVVDGVTNLRGQEVFALKFLQGRDPEWVGQPFFARFDATATWLDDLVPAFGEPEFFYEAGLRRLQRRAHRLHLVDDDDNAVSVRSANL